jgi:hypothetical protein
MPGARLLTRVVVAGGLFVSVGCVRWTHLAPAELEVHGKAGQVCSAVVTPLVWSVNTILFPVSVASLGQEPASHDNLGYPGLAVENGAYVACATLGLPLSMLDRGTESVFLGLADREAVEDYLIGRLPFLSPGDYGLLVRTARRTCPPRYDREEASLPGAGAGTDREFGLWSTAAAPRYGSKPSLGNPLAAAEWRDWRTAGRPRDADAEIAFTVNRALEFSDPPRQFAATYGPEQRPRFERERAAQQAAAAALAGFAAEAGSCSPSPIVRAAAARLLAGSRAAGATGGLTRLLGDRAVMVRAAAADGLASLADPEGADALGRALSDGDPLVRERAALALGKIASEAAAGLLLRSLGNLGHRARFEALGALADAGGPRVREALAAALADRDLHTRIAAAAAIGRSAPDAGDPLLGRALGDPEPWVSGSATRGFERRDRRGDSRSERNGAW